MKTRNYSHFVLFIIIINIILIFIPFSRINVNDKFIVVLDAGHGGHDPGNLGNRI